MAYATASDLQDYLSEELVADLPSDDEQGRLLERASELIDYVTLDRIDSDDDDHLEAAKKATLAQCEFWLSSGDDSGDVTGPIQGYQIGSLQIQYGAGSNRITPTTLAPRARRYLFLAGLLNRGVGIS